MKLFNIKSFHTLLKINYVHTVNSNGFRIMSHLEQSNLKTVKLAYSSFTSKHTDFTKEPLILMHGMFGYKRNFETIAKSLSNKLLRQIYTVDMRNHADSERSGHMCYESMSADVESLLRDTLHIDSAVILGHSMGGKVAMMLALTEPSLVHKLIVVDISPNSMRREDSEKFRKFISVLNIVDLNAQGHTMPEVRRNADKFLSTIMTDASVRSLFTSNIIEKDGVYDWKFNVSAIFEHLDKLMSFPDIDDLTYSGATKFISGEKSNYISESAYPEIQRLFPTVEFEAIPGAGHWVHSEKPHEFIAIVEEFVKRED